MAGLLRSKQSGIASDLSAGITSSLFTPHEQTRLGINSKTTCLAYEPVQSLLALATSASKFGNGKIYVFGHKRVQRVFEPPRSTSLLSLHFSANRLISLDQKSEVNVWNLESGAHLFTHSIVGGISCLCADPSLDWIFLGLRSGEVVAYDLDRGQLAAEFKIPNVWSQDPQEAKIAIVSLAIHPRDLGQLLIGYTHGAVVFSIKQNKPIKRLNYRPASREACGISTNARSSALTHAVWHPTGTFIATVHDDGNLVVWDLKEEQVLVTRNLGQHDSGSSDIKPEPDRRQRMLRLAWCCKQNPDDTALLVADWVSDEAGVPTLTFIELGPTPVYAASSWQSLRDHFTGKRTICLPLPAQMSDFLLIPRTSPHYAGSQDPLALIINLSGELITLSFPSGHPITPINQLHPSVSLIHPYASKFAVATVTRERWLGLTESRAQGERIIKGGAPGPKPRRRFDDRTILQVAHADGTLRLWDPGHGDEIENETQLQVDVARALDRHDKVDITAMSLAGPTAELAVGTDRGELVIYKWAKNQSLDREVVPEVVEASCNRLQDISSRAEPTLMEGLQPLVLYEMNRGSITSVHVSDVGFVAVGSVSGHLTFIDLRGPMVMLETNVQDLGKDKRSSFLRPNGGMPSNAECPVVIEFGAMTLDDDKYSSIACFVGTSTGRVLTFKILPTGARYTACFLDSTPLQGEIKAICPVATESGKPARLTAETMQGLREGRQISGVLLVVSQTQMRIFRPAKHRGASKDFDAGSYCDAACVAEFELRGHAIIGVFQDRTARAYSIPALKEIGRAPLPGGGQSVVMPNGTIFIKMGPSEIIVMNCWGGGRELASSDDILINPQLHVPPRPTISNIEWLSGTQHISTSDFDILIGGPTRPPSKRMITAIETATESSAAKAALCTDISLDKRDEGWGDYLTRQLNERTEKLNLMGDHMDNLSSSTQGWADDVSKFVRKKKKDAVLGSITGKFF